MSKSNISATKQIKTNTKLYKLLYIITIITILISCSILIGFKIYRLKTLYSPEKMALVLADLKIADNIAKKQASIRFDDLYNKVLASHDVNHKNFIRSFKYYLDHHKISYMKNISKDIFDQMELYNSQQ